MRAALPLALTASMIACASTPTPPATPALRTIALKNPGFEDPAVTRPCPVGWDCTMHNDPTSFRFFHDVATPASGKASLCIEHTG